MGIADVIPGISGGTIAFALGIYPKLLEGIKSTCSRPFFPLREKIQKKETKFLFTLLLGMISAILLGARFILFLLSMPLSKAYLYAAFMGLMCATAYFTFKSINQMSKKSLFFAALAFVCTALLTLNDASGLEVKTDLIAWHPKFFIAGMLAVIAMLLPGISGSFVLVILGVYKVIIETVVSLSLGHISLTSLLFLFNFLLGVLCGAITFSYVVECLFKKYEDSSKLILTGCMLGSLPALWPFYDLRPSVISFEAIGAFILFLAAMTLAHFLQIRNKACNPV